MSGYQEMPFQEGSQVTWSSMRGQKVLATVESISLERDLCCVTLTYPETSRTLEGKEQIRTRREIVKLDALLRELEFATLGPDEHSEPPVILTDWQSSTASSDAPPDWPLELQEVDYYRCNGERVLARVTSHDLQEGVCRLEYSVSRGSLDRQRSALLRVEDLWRMQQQRLLPQRFAKLTSRLRPLQIDKVEERGITIGQLKSLLHFMKKRCTAGDVIDGWHCSRSGEVLRVPTMNLYQVCDWIIKPFTEPSRCSYVEAVAEAAESQQPEWFVSHWWLLQLRESFRMSDMTKWAPRLSDVFRRHDWSWNSSTHVITWASPIGDRYFRVGYDSLATLNTWRREHWLKMLFSKEKRVQGTWKRDAAGSNPASGLQLNPPVGDGIPDLSAHAKLARGGHENYLHRSVVVATGVSVWHATRSHAAQGFEATRQSSLCLCGLEQPSMPHLLWACSGTQNLRRDHNVRLPVDTCEERLLCTLVPQTPPPEFGTSCRPSASNDLIRWLRSVLGSLTLYDGIALIATDGGAADGCSTYGIALNAAAFGGHVPGEDASNVTAELFAVCALLEALVAVIGAGSVGLPTDMAGICVAVDCKPAIDLAWRTLPPDDRWKYVSDIMNHRSALAEANLPVSFTWVPSHGKEAPNWTPDDRFGEALLRKLNDMADKAATAKLEPLRMREPRRTWTLRKAAASAWSTKALEYAIAVSTVYYPHVKVNSSFTGSN
eukprot:TRINITY_DN8032_c0_g1_i10.p1 TRINITY_DN8032_c0_g1~~TRINITY_DN8032_c0_g1_i10.p1  ORF type:complete len:718 (-),score=122.62 TRINITY_DN8032_c0_g1_i10:217-2370(-)